MSISREACLQALEDAVDELGHAPTVEEYKALAISPSYNTIIARYDTWLNALDHLDADRAPRVRFTEADCIEALRAAAEEIGSDPSMREYDQADRTPTAETIAKRFDGWSDAKAEAGVTDDATATSSQ